MTYSSRNTLVCKIWFDDRSPLNAGFFLLHPRGPISGSLAIARRIAPAGKRVSVARPVSGSLVPLPPATRQGQHSLPPRASWRRAQFLKSRNYVSILTQKRILLGILLSAEELKQFSDLVQYKVFSSACPFYELSFLILSVLQVFFQADLVSTNLLRLLLLWPFLSYFFVIYPRPIRS